MAYLLGASETPPADAVELPSYEDVAARTPDGLRVFAEATRTIHRETNPLNARRLIQRHGDRVVVVNPPAMPLDEREMDAVYGLPYLRTPHPSYREAIPADAMIRDSVTIMRGCFGGCTFCSITTHQGRIISSRSEASVLREVKALAASPTFKGTVSDLGGPTANMYQMRCTKPEVEQICRRLSCVHPKVCKLLGTDHGPLIDLMQKSRAVKGVARVNIASGIRMDLARLDPRYVRELAAHHVGGHLKVAPEHTDPTTLELMKKPGVEDFDVFARQFKAASSAAGKPKQYLVPYYIASHPGSTVEAMIDLALYLKRNGYRPRQVQDFIPAPMDIATCMYYTGLDPMTMQPVAVARATTDRKMQRALLQFFKPENYFETRRALLSVGRGDLIGDGCDALIPATPPREAIEARMAAARKFDPTAPGADLDQGGYHHAPPAPKAVGYRPGRPIPPPDPSERRLTARPRCGPSAGGWARPLDWSAQVSAIAGHVGGFACVLNFGDVPPGIGLAAVEIGEAVDLRKLPAGQRLSVPARHVGVLRERRDGPADERWALGDREVGRARCRVTPVRFGDFVGFEHGL